MQRWWRRRCKSRGCHGNARANGSADRHGASEYRDGVSCTHTHRDASCHRAVHSNVDAATIFYRDSIRCPNLHAISDPNFDRDTYGYAVDWSDRHRVGAGRF
jgi:hypothetical protein